MAYPGRNNIYTATIRRMVAQALEAQEREFGLTHGNDSDEALLDYLRSCAEALRHTPWPREIVGGSLIAQRFGSWQNALLKAQIPRTNLPDKTSNFARYQEEEQRQKQLYRQKKAEKAALAEKRRAKQKKQRNNSTLLGLRDPPCVNL